MVEVVQSPSPGVSAEELASLSSPDTLDTPFGMMEFFDGVPLRETVARSYDALDLLRGVDVFLNCMPGASMLAMRNGLRSVGARSNVIACTDPRSTSAPVVLTANTETTYGTTFIDLKSDGPTVIECPPNSLSFVDDLWQRYVADMGNAGPDRGQGGKYLFLPPGHEGDVPDGFFVFESPTYSNWVVIRALDGLDALLTTRIYPLAAADDPPNTGFVDFAAASFNTTPTTSASSRKSTRSSKRSPKAPSTRNEPGNWQQSASCAVDRSNPTRGCTASSNKRPGSALGSPAPSCTSPATPTCTSSKVASWKTAFVGGSYEFLADGARMLDHRALMHYVGTGITPAMTHAAPGIGSQYAYTVDDANGDTLDGAKSYTLTLPAPIPVKTFWAIDIYDTQTRSLLQTDNPYPSINDRFGDLHAEGNGDIVVWFGPEPPTKPDTQLAANGPRQELVPDPASLRPSRSLVRPDLATRGDPTRVAGARASSADRADGRRRGGWLTTTSPDSATVPSAVASRMIASGPSTIVPHAVRPA